MKNKCCGNCKHFKDEGINGFGFCVVFECVHHCTGGGRCVAHQFNDNGWTEITPDNVDEVDCIEQEKVVIGWLDNKGRRHIAALVDCPPVKSSLAGRGYYYYVLPD